ncbi:MAG: hypothetical protein VW540_06280 [Gammaproteobacteria bacterium]
MLDASKPEIIASDEHQKLLKIDDKTLYLTWNKYINAFEGTLYRQVQDRYGRFVNDFVTNLSGMSENEIIQEAKKI